MKSTLVALTSTAVLVLGGAAVVALPAHADDADPGTCTPSDAWTETVEHPAVAHVVHHPAVTHEETVTVVDKEAWVEVIPAKPDLWWNWSPNHQQGPFNGPPNFPNDSRGTWQGPHENGGPQQNTYGTFQNGNGHGSWFHREKGAAKQTINHPAQTHTETKTVIDKDAWDETVVDKDAWTEKVEHPAVTCPEEPTPTCGDEDYTPVGDECETEEPPIVTEPPVTETPTPTDTPTLIPPVEVEVPSVEQSCTDRKCVKITRDPQGNIIQKDVVKYDNPREEGL